MLRIGITGGIGSGKSIVCSVLSELGYPVFHSDQVAKDLLNENPAIAEEIKTLFGSELYTDGIINRQKLAAIVFNDAAARERINAIVHPHVRKAFSDFINRKDARLVFNEAAILFETGSYKQFDANILVTAPEELRIERVMKRDGVERADVIKRIKAQWTDEQKAELADYVLINDEKKPLLEQIESTVNELLNRSR